jgi:4'-phosphopantetheinyl transferase
MIVYYGLADSFIYKLPVLYEYLSESEKARADRFKYVIDYNCYVTVHALLRIELAKVLGVKARLINICLTDYGKPFIPDTDLPFSISRAKNLFAFAIGESNQYLGVDIEQVKPEIDFMSITRNYFSASEQKLISSLKRRDDQKRTFFELWTRKEALLKAIGVGISGELRKVEVLEGENMLDLVGKQINNHSFKVATSLQKEAMISIASSSDFVPDFKNLSFILS